MRKKMIALILAAVMAVSAMGISAMAIVTENTSSSNVKVIDEQSSENTENAESEEEDADGIETYMLDAASSEEEIEEIAETAGTEEESEPVIGETAEETEEVPDASAVSGTLVTTQEVGSSRSVESEASNEAEEADTEAVETSDGSDSIKIYVNGAEKDSEDPANVISAASSDATEAETEEDEYGIFMYSGTDNKANTSASNTLDVIFVMGQSNAEGEVATNFSTDVQQQVLCDEDMIYSTVIPMSAGGSKISTGISYSSDVTASQVDQYIASTLGSTESVAGNTLVYKQNALSANGTGKTGPDAGIAYEWNQKTGHMVWIVNIAYGGSSVNRWTPSADDLYPIATAAIDSVLNVINKDVSAGKYTMGQTLMFWLQGEADKGMAYDSYLTRFDAMVDDLNTRYHYDGFGIISVRAACDANMGTADIADTGPRLAQPVSAAARSNVFMVSTANEQWVSDSGVKNYFNSAYPNGIKYNVRCNSTTTPSKESDVHPNIHYTQMGHNENGITAADGMYSMLKNPPATTPEPTVGLNDINGTLTYMKDGKKYSYTGFAEYNGDWYYVKDGTVSKTRNDILEGNVNGSQGWYYIVNGKVDTSYTGVSNFENAYGWWYINKGKVDFSVTSVEENQYGWWYVKEGKVDFSFTGIASNRYGDWYIEGGQVIFSKNGTYTDSSGQKWTITAGSAVKVQSGSSSTSGTGFKKDGNDWYYYKNGVKQTGLNDILEDTEGVISGTGKSGSWYYIVNGRVDTSYTGVSNFCNAYGWWYIENGKVNFNKTSVEENQYGWWYVKDGKVDFSYTGIAANQWGNWYIQGGQVIFSKNDIIECTVNGTNGWWYIVDGKVDTSYTGVSHFSNAYGWWYIKNGKVDFSFTGVAANQWAYWYCKEGKVDFSKNGTYTDSSGQSWSISGGEATKVGYTGYKQEGSDWYYYKNGTKQTSMNDILEDTAGVISGNGKSGSWYYIVNGKVDMSYTGVSHFSNAYGWWYIKNGKVDFSFTGCAANQWAYWYCKEGKVDFSKNGTYTDSSGTTWNIVAGEATKVGYTGFKQDGSDWYYYKNDVKQTSMNDILEGAVNGSNGWWYIVNGKVDFSYTGVSHFSNAYGWWYIKNGKVDFSMTGVEANQYGYWRVVDGKVDFSCNSIELGADGKWYYIVGGEVQSNYTGVGNYCNNYGWWYVKNGVVDFSFTGLASNNFGTWYCKEGKVDFSFNGTYDGKTVSGGKVV